jgi:hypothetical protein
MALLATGVGTTALWAYWLTRLALDVPGLAWALIGALFATATIIGTYLDGELFYFQRGIAR